ERGNDRYTARPDELCEEREVHRFDRPGVVVAQDHGLAVLHRADVLLLSDEQPTRQTREADRVDPTLLELLDVREVLDPQGGHGEDLEGAAVGAAAHVTGWRRDLLLRNGEGLC